MPSAWCLRGWKRCVPTGRRWPSSFNNKSYTCASSATSRIRICAWETIAELMNGELDEQLVYRKRLRRPLAEYQRNVPPHVRAARLADEHNLKLGRAQQYQRHHHQIRLDHQRPGAGGLPAVAARLRSLFNKAAAAGGGRILPFVNDDFTIVTGQLGLF